jgi:hypothetical protein
MKYDYTAEMKMKPDVRAAGVISEGFPSHMNSGNRLLHGQRKRADAERGERNPTEVWCSEA